MKVAVEVVGIRGDVSASATEDLQTRLHDVTLAIRELADDLRRELRQAGDRDAAETGLSLSEVSMGFNVSLSAESGVFIGKVRGSGTFEVQLKLTQSR